MAPPRDRSRSRDAKQASREVADAENGGGDVITDCVGWHDPHFHSSFSEESCRRAAAFHPGADDVFVATAPKTGTTWLQMVCHAVRTRGDHEDFSDVYQAAPWDQMAWDLGQDLHAEQVARPRIFKTHLRLASLNRGAKYLCCVRDVERTLLSWWRFLKDKDVPPLRRYTSPSEFVFDEGFVLGGMRFGATIWEYYTEFFLCRSLPNVLVLCYEDLEANLEDHLDIIADFLGVPPLTADEIQRVCRLCSREGMAAVSHKFDESWTYRELQRIGRAPDNASSFCPAPRVHAADDGDKTSRRLNAQALDMLQRKWNEHVAPKTSLQDYEALRFAIREELKCRRVQPTCHDHAK